jgi:hypothetical protein
VGNPEEKRTLGRSRRRWEDNIKMDFREIGWDGVDWIDLAQEGTCKHGNGPSGSIKCSEIREYLSDWQLLKKGSAPWS